MNAPTVVTTTFLASAVEVIEMVAIVLGVGVTRGWRSTLAGAAAGVAVLAAVVVALGTAITAIPIGGLRLVVGALLLVFGLQWLRKGVRRVAARGLTGGLAKDVVDEEDRPPDHGGMDWTAFVLAFKGVVLEGLEIAFIVVTFGAAAGRYGLAAAGGAAAVLVIGAAGAAAHGVVRQIPRSTLMLVVGTLLTSFGSFWSVEGLGVEWPGGDGAILGLLALYAAMAAVFVVLLRRGAPRLRPAAQGG